ncbi:MAG: glycosyl transferase [Patescibacteria group bacterium]|nr:MAG: glycosyl transferase [Patescibacteria group bacterium]
MNRKDFLVSIVIPVYNEEQALPKLFPRLLPVIEKYNYELIFVNDGSKDSSDAIIKNIAKSNKRVKLISFQRNFGHQIALSCGYDFAKGDCVITLDADLQDPPEVIDKMIAKWQEGFEIVYGQRLDRQTDSFFKRTTADFFYKFMNYLSDVKIPQHVADFRLLDKKVVEFLRGLKERSRFLRGLVVWPGFKSAIVSYRREKRSAGKTHYSLRKMLSFAFEGIISFSTRPLQLATYLGFISAFLGFIGIIYAVIGKFVFSHYWVTGWTALFVSIMFMGGVQLIAIGIIGEYVGKIYKEVQERPLYLVKEKVNLD